MNKFIVAFMAVWLMVGVSVAYNRSYVDPKENITGSELPDRITDGIIETSQDYMGSFGQNLGKYLVIIIFIIALLFIFKVLRGGR